MYGRLDKTLDGILDYSKDIIPTTSNIYSSSIKNISAVIVYVNAMFSCVLVIFVKNQPCNNVISSLFLCTTIQLLTKNPIHVYIVLLNKGIHIVNRQNSNRIVLVKTVSFIFSSPFSLAFVKFDLAKLLSLLGRYSSHKSS